MVQVDPGKTNLSAVAQDILADQDNLRSLGSNAKRWKALYAVLAVIGALSVGGIYIAATSDDRLIINASTIINGSLEVIDNITMNPPSVIKWSEKERIFSPSPQKFRIYSEASTQFYVNDYQNLDLQSTRAKFHVNLSIEESHRFCYDGYLCENKMEYNGSCLNTYINGSLAFSQCP